VIALSVVVGGSHKRRYAESRRANAAPKEWPTRVTEVVLYVDKAFWAVDRISSAVLSIMLMLNVLLISQKLNESHLLHLLLRKPIVTHDRSVDARK
jgi:hypothetical protein